MSDFEDRLGRALDAGAADAPGAEVVAGLAGSARAGARRRRTRQVVGGAVAAVVVLALAMPVALRGTAGDDLTIAGTVDGWRTVSFERESYDSEVDTITVLVDVPAAWVELPDPDTDECGSADLGVAADGCATESMSVYADSGNLDHTFGPGLRARDDYGYPVDSDWGGYVDLGGAYVDVSSDDREVALRVLASARYEGTDIPDLAGEWPVTVRQGLGFPDPGLDEAAGYGVEVAERRAREEYPYAEQVGPERWRASATVGDQRIEVVAPTSAIAQVVAGSAGVVEDAAGDGWRTVTYEGDPVDESGDATVLVDLPPGWERSDCRAAGLVAYSSAPSSGCGDETQVRISYEYTLDYAGPGLSVDDDGSATGLVRVGALVVSAEGADHDTVRRILASVRQPGDPAPSATWRTEDLGAGVTFDVPSDGSVVWTFSSPFTQEVPESRQARPTRDGWTAVVGTGPGNQLAFTAPTQALADVVASTVRPID